MVKRADLDCAVLRMDVGRVEVSPGLRALRAPSIMQRHLTPHNARVSHMLSDCLIYVIIIIILRKHSRGMVLHFTLLILIRLSVF